MIENQPLQWRHSTPTRHLALVFAIGSFFALMYFILLNWTAVPVDILFEEPLYMYSIGIYLVALTFAAVITRKTKAFTPSMFLFLQFVSIPVLGVIGYESFAKRYGHALELDAVFPYSTWIWSLGTLALFAGAALYHALVPERRPRYRVRWNIKRTGFLVVLTFCISLAFTAMALLKIGYIPALYRGIGAERGNYLDIIGIGMLTGTNVMRVSSLAIISGAIAWMLAVQGRSRRVYLVVALASLLLLSWSSYRSMSVFLVLTAVLYLCKYWLFITRRQIVVGSTVLACMLFGYLLYPEYRTQGRAADVSALESVSVNLFGEWREYSRVVGNVRASGHYYGDKLFLGQVIPVLPRQVWAMLGIDKDYVIENFTGAYVIGDEMDHGLGIRIGPIGEAYAGYGVVGVLIHMFCYGLLLGLLERIYLTLDRRDARHVPICFLLALFLHLPFTSLYARMCNVSDILPVMIIVLMMGTDRCRVGQRWRRSAMSPDVL